MLIVFFLFIHAVHAADRSWREHACSLIISNGAQLHQRWLKTMPPCAAKKGAKTSASTAMSLTRMLSDGPEVSLSGSPMVSPITAALCASEPLGPSDLASSVAPASMYF